MGTPLRDAPDKTDKDSILTYLAENDCKVQKAPTTSQESGIIVQGATSISSKVQQVFDLDPEHTSEFNQRIKERKKELGID